MHSGHCQDRGQPRPRVWPGSCLPGDEHFPETFLTASGGTRGHPVSGTGSGPAPACATGAARGGRLWEQFQETGHKFEAEGGVTSQNGQGHRTRGGRTSLRAGSGVCAAVCRRVWPRTCEHICRCAQVSIGSYRWCVCRCAQGSIGSYRWCVCRCTQVSLGPAGGRCAQVCAGVPGLLQVAGVCRCA